MRIVIDTNVLLSAILFGGVPGRILEAWRDGRVRVVMSPEIIAEHVQVGERLADRYPGVDVLPIIALIVEKSDAAPDSVLPNPVCQDPDDDQFLACALAAEVKLVVGGDKGLRAASGHAGTGVVTSRQFVDRWL